MASSAKGSSPDASLTSSGFRIQEPREAVRRPSGGVNSQRVEPMPKADAGPSQEVQFLRDSSATNRSSSKASTFGVFSLHSSSYHDFASQDMALLARDPTAPTKISEHERINFKLWAYGMTNDQLIASSGKMGFGHMIRKDRWPEWRMNSFKLVVGSPFNAFCGAIIVMNSVCLALEADITDETVLTWTRTARTFFIFWFAVETLLRFMGRTDDYFHGWGWLLLDVFILLTCLVVYLLDVVFLGDGVLGSWVWNLVVFRLFRVLQLYNTLSPKREFAVISGALNQVWLKFLGIAVFCVVLFFTFALLSKSYFQGTDDEDVQAIVDEFFPTIWAAALTAFTATTGGLSWDELTEPMISSDQVSPQGLVTFLIFFVLAFCLVNLFLGIFVHEVLQQAEAYDKNLECLDLLQGQTSVQKLEAVLDKIDLDQDGCISSVELQDAVADQELCESLGVKPRDLVALHCNLDTEGTGDVTVSEFLFGLLQLLGTSKSLDFLTIDYRLKCLLRQISATEGDMVDRLGTLNLLFRELEHKTRAVGNGLSTMNDAIFWTVYERQAKVRHLAEQLAANRRKNERVLSLQAIQRVKERTDARAAIRYHMQTLQHDVRDLAWTMSYRSTWQFFGAKSKTVLRTVVRELLDSELKPWLDTFLEDYAADLRPEAQVRMPSPG